MQCGWGWPIHSFWMISKFPADRVAYPGGSARQAPMHPQVCACQTARRHIASLLRMQRGMMGIYVRCKTGWEDILPDIKRAKFNYMY